MERDGKVLVAGGGGFIGGHLVAELIRRGHSQIRVVDHKAFSDWYQIFPQADNVRADLRDLEACRDATRDVRYVFNLAADMGGMGFIETHKAACMLSVLISTHMLMASQEATVERLFYSSSACIYPVEKQVTADVVALREHDAYPAMPEDGYGWEKLFSERMCRHFWEDFGLATRIARYHNVYGPNGTYDGGREKAPAAICRKVVAAKLGGSGEIEIWGDGRQTRSFMYVDDCVKGSLMILESDEIEPLNLGSDRLVTIDRLVDIVERIGGVKLKRRYNLSAPKGVRGRNSDNTLISERLGWAPAIPLEVGLERTYRWIYDQISGGLQGRASPD
jgi:nucleoside-diphosphate-sugar epimerase